MGLSVMCPLLKYSEKVSNKICIYFTSGGISYASLSGSAGKSVLSVTPSCGKPSSFCSCKQSRNTTAWDRFPLRLIWNITHHFPLPIKTLCGLMWLMKYWTRYTIRYTISSASGLRKNTKGIENLPTVRNKSEKAPSVFLLRYPLNSSHDDQRESMSQSPLWPQYENLAWK